MFPQLFGKYVLERELAQGGMARVYLATLRGAVGFEKRLVVKQIRPELASDHAFVQRFVEEAKTAVELSHPNIVPVYELGVEQGVYYIAMEFCAGVTLTDLLRDGGKLSPEEGAYVGVEICRALDYAHRRAGIVHRDVTPRNVLVDEEGAVRLIDFGIAAPVAEGGAATSEVFGSPGHMPPEQIAGGALTPAADVFAVAALLVEVWSARPPFRRATARESHAALAEPIAPLGEHDHGLQALDELIRASLAPDPRDRPGDAELFARPLREFLRSVDSGDVARRVGARAARARSRARSRENSGSEAPNTRGSSGAHAPLTKTFAARNEVEAWTRRIESAPAIGQDRASTGPRTRKIPSLPPAGSPVRKYLIAAGTLILVALGASWLSSYRPLPPSSAPSAVARRAPRPGTALPRAETAAVAAAKTPAPPPSSELPAAHVATAQRSTAVLRLTADPAASVSIHGMGQRRVLTTPVRELRVPAGSYTVTFRSATYDTPLVTRIDVPGDAVRSVHADFREVDPSLTVR